MRIRQIVFAARDLAQGSATLAALLGLDPPSRDPGALRRAQRASDVRPGARSSDNHPAAEKSAARANSLCVDQTSRTQWSGTALFSRFRCPRPRRRG